MARFVLARGLGLLVVLLMMTLIIFLLQQVIPSDPARAIAGPNAPRALVEAKREELGLNDPVLERYGRYLSDLSRGNLGVSVRTKNPVRTDLARFLPASVELMTFALLLGVVLGVILAFVQVLSPRAAPLRLLLLSGSSTPVFLVGLLLLLVLWFKLGWFPHGGRLSMRDVPEGPTGILTLDGIIMGRLDVTWNAFTHLILPGFALALPIAVAVGRTLRSSLVNVLRQDYVRTARSKGLGEFQVVFRHSLRNASTAPLAMVGLQVALLFANIIIIERIFSWPGLGLYTSQALAYPDLPAVLGVSLVFGTIYVLINAVIDLLQAWADPRVSLT